MHLVAAEIKKKQGLSKAGGLAKQSAFLLFGNVFTLIVGFLFQVYLAKVLGADGLGLFGIYESVVTVFSGLLGFGLAQTVVKYIPYYQVKSDFSSIRNLLRKGFKNLSIAGFSAYFVVVLAACLAPYFFSDLEIDFALVPVMGLMIPLGLLLFFVSQALRGFFDIRYIVVGSSFLQLTAKVILSIALFGLGLKLIGYIWAVVLSSLIAFLWMLRGVMKHVRIMPVDRDPSLQSANSECWNKYARTMYGNSLLGTLTGPLDRFALGYFLGTSSVGVLMVTKVINGLPVIFLLMFIGVVSPMLSAAYAKSDMEEFFNLYHLTTDWLMRLSFPLLIFLFCFSKNILNVYGDEFSDYGNTALLILLFSQLINLTCGPIGIALNMAGMERDNFKLSITTTIMSFLLIFLLTPSFGIDGTCVAIAAPIIYQNLKCVRIANLKIGMKWWSTKYRKNILPILISTTFSLLMLSKNINFNLFELTIVLIFVYLFFWTSHLLQGINDDDRLVFNLFLEKFLSIKN